MDKRVTRQDSAKAALNTAIAEHHAEKLLLMASGAYLRQDKQKLPALSPVQIVGRSEFLCQTTGQSLYSADQVQQLLHQRAGGDSASAAPLPICSLASPQHPERLTDPTSPPSIASQQALSTRSDPPRSMASTTSKIVVVCKVTTPPMSMPVRIQPSWTLDDILAQLTKACALPTQHSFHLLFAQESGGLAGLSDIKDVREILLDPHALGTWVFCAIIPRTPQSQVCENQALLAEVSRQLSYGSLESESIAQLSQALKLQQFEQAAMADLKAAVKGAVQPYGEKVGKAGQSTVETFYQALRVLDELTKLWDRRNKLAARRNDPTPEQQRLHWFIEAILEVLADDVKLRWNGQKELEQCEANYYS
jgi:hypothetical protein